MNRFIEVTVNDSKFTNEPKEFIGATKISGRVLLEISNIQCVCPAEKGSLIILKTRKTSDIADISSECDYNELIVEETYESLKQILI